MYSSDFESFITLDAVARNGSVTAAALELNKTVATISQRLSKLESHYNISMLDRSGYKLVLTPNGERLLVEAHKLIQQANRIDAVAKQLADNWEPALEIVVDGILNPDPILESIAEINRLNAPTTFNLTTEYLGGVEQRFRQASADIMLSVGYSNQKDCLYTHIFSIHLILVASPRIGINAKQTYSMATLSQYLEICVRDSAKAPSTSGQSFNGLNVFNVNDFYTKKRAILQGMGIGWMPSYWVEAELNSGDLIEIQFDAGSRNTYTIYTATWKNKHIHKAQVEFLNRLKSKF